MIHGVQITGGDGSRKPRASGDDPNPAYPIARDGA